MNKAFTLVELAIVIVIIGLLVGGVLQGQELINQAKIRSQIKQFGTFDTAALVFKSKYNFIPGDLTVEAAASFGFDTLIFPNGGDNRLGINVPSTSSSGEPQTFFYNLSEKILIKERVQKQSANYSVGVAFPENEFKTSGVAAVTHTDGIYYFLGPTIRDDTTNKHHIYLHSANPSILPSDAAQLDSKIDDGIPSQGTVRAVIVSSTAANSLANDSTTGSCLGTSNQVYNLTTNNLLCRIIVKSKL